MTEKASNVIPFEDPRLHKLYDLIYDAYEDVVEEAYNERGKLDDDDFDVLAFQVTAEFLGYLEGRLIRRGIQYTAIDIVRQSRADIGLCTEIALHKSQCTRPNCEAPGWFAKARKRYAYAVVRVEDGKPGNGLWAKIRAWIKSRGWRRRTDAK